MAPSTVVHALKPVVETLNESVEMLSSMATTLHQAAITQIQTMGQLQLMRRDFFLRQAPRTLPPEALATLRQAPLGGPMLFGDASIHTALDMKEKGEQSHVNRSLIKQATKDGYKKPQKSQYSTSNQQKRTEYKGFKDTTSRGRGRGQNGSGANPFRANRPGNASFQARDQQPYRGRGRGGNASGNKWKSGKP
jgi:hypothetical protein